VQLPNATNRTAFLTGLWSGSVLVTQLLLAPKLVDAGYGDGVFIVGPALAILPTFPFVFGYRSKNEATWNKHLDNPTPFFSEAGTRVVCWFIGGTLSMVSAYFIIQSATGAT